MKFVAKVGSLALIAAAAAGVVVGCSGQDLSKPSTSAQGEGQKGTVGLTLQPVAGITLNTVHYTVTKSGVTTPVADGDLPTPGAASTFSFGLPLPVGTGYTLSISGVSMEKASITCTGSSAQFAVTANTSSKITSVLTCIDSTNGDLETGVTVLTDACPRLIVDYVVATPSTAFLPTGTISLASNAHDLDGKPVTYSWKVSSPAVGSFAPIAGKTSVFTCALDSGANPVDIIVTADNGQCKKSLPTAVSCKSLSCGNGVLDSSEECDPAIAGGSNCLPNCTTPKCGNGVVDVPFETCDLGPTPHLDVCDATCHTVPIECGDGILSPLEQCDGTLFPPGTPPGTFCTPFCTIPIPTIECGDGIKQPGEVCDPKLTVNDCGRNCQSITSAACLACEQSADYACSPSVLTCDTATGGTVTATVTGSSGAAKPTDPGAVTTPIGTAKASLCNEVLDCVRDSGCAADGQPALKTCYCGTASVPQCNAGQGNGACKAEIERSLEATDFATVSQNFGKLLYGGGVAMKRIDCDNSFCPVACF